MAAGKKTKKRLPFVTLLTPTYNRRPFIEASFEMFRNQSYPKERIEWIIIDDGTDKIRDLVEKSGIPQIKYYELPEKITLGAKRNLLHKYSSGDKESILVNWDDDDYYPPERISHAVETLQKNPQALCSGSSEIYIYYKHISKMYQAGPYGPNHATAGTFAFRKKLLDEHHYENTACLAEEKAFLKNYTVPFAQLDPLKTILVFSHTQNTFDKKKLLSNPHPLYFKESGKNVDLFIRNPNETALKKFFMEDIDAALKSYAPGDPSMKPDVIVQMKEIEK
jgi:glycosyltransferase involved in cell wall biosynthesis